MTKQPKITRGSHSTRTEYPDGRVEFVTHWDELVRDVDAALKSLNNLVQITEEKVKKTRKKK
jgi:CBS-domain-containing membrane protein